jgi:hypothetical protein
MIAALALALLLATPATPRFETAGAEALVRTLYKADHIPTEKAGIERFFSRDLAPAMIADHATGELSAIEFDYRFHSQDPEITKLTFAGRPMIGGAIVTVNFRNAGKAETVTYRLCQRIGGDWRIFNVEGKDLDMRKMLKVSAAPVRC